MIKTLKCPYCGQLNKVETDWIGEALCGTCKQSFSGPVLPPELSGSGTVPALETGTVAEAPPETTGWRLPDIGKWISKIGDHAKQEEYVRKGFFKKIKKASARIPFSREAVAMYYCAMDSQTPLKAKLTAIGALAYIILPIDAIPDFIVGLGYTDDAAAFWVAYKSISAHVTDEHREKATEWFDR